ncbi:MULTISPECIES: CoA ester lyase [unclassified Oceanispirochaeta]|uniref:HpcH/HpaI aldolase/citrate lyase family protein n=1 Tax=unclassified Oceanispirochaeta TaxID=2635722 RepID=UPI000E08FD70|nr:MULTISPECIES: CoA ester lyase [unclassified Oceanispirochaeta]MBF9018532.1 CoA ester lyase [Oceanispirochaeta sp. M2]NPD74939.1 CoA ester lyase [Oceanispirochaeta sp. M1]RDG29220.1 CoA ester lyase [Oceanispirochaeta sp. M1]
MISWLYVPGNSPGMMLNAALYGADGLVLDLEDSVAAEKKEEARFLVSQAVMDYDFNSVALAVRINDMESLWWEEDLNLLIDSGVRLFRIPKMESISQIHTLEDILNHKEKEFRLQEGDLGYHMILETPRGVEESYNLSCEAKHAKALCFGAEDFCASMGSQRHQDLLRYPRSRIASSAAAVGIESYDSIWAAFKDQDGLTEDAKIARSLGFTGKSLIHPDQIDIVNRIFMPDKEEIEWARNVLKSLDQPENTGAFSLKGTMVDTPVIKRARRIISRLQENTQ